MDGLKAYSELVQRFANSGLVSLEEARLLLEAATADDPVYPGSQRLNRVLETLVAALLPQKCPDCGATLKLSDNKLVFVKHNI